MKIEVTKNLNSILTESKAWAGREKAAIAKVVWIQFVTTKPVLHWFLKNLIG